jgi:putative autoinducer-2 (AI-2) aldolase
VPPTVRKPVALRLSAGNTILDDRLFETEVLGASAEEALRLNVSAIAVQVCVGAPAETPTIANLVAACDIGSQYGLPVLGVTAVGKQLTRDARYLGLATRVLAEIGATVIKTYYCDEGFEDVVAGCPVPIVIAGGKKLPELDALALAHNAIRKGACGVDMGRNIFQSEHPVAMLRAVRSVVHEGRTPQDALDLYQQLSREE